MKIEKLNEKRCFFKDIVVGGVFESEYNIFIKINETLFNTLTNPINAINLKQGTGEFFTDKDEVILHKDAKVVI